MYEHTVNGRVYQRRAWTGGDRPPVSSNDHSWNMAPEYTGPFTIIRCQLYREQLGDWFAYWGDLPDKDTRYLFWRRATADAWRTVTHLDNAR